MIKNLPRQLNEAGKIKIGKKGKTVTSAKGNEFRPPQKLDHFQLTTTEKDENSDYIVDVDLQNKIKKAGSGLVNKDGCLVGLPIRLVYNDLESNFPHRYVSYVGGQLSCHGDGDTAKKRLDDFEKEHKCPCQRITPGYDGKDKCKITGTLTCVIDEAGLFGQAHKFRTTSMNTVKGIIGGIELISEATNGRIAWLPLMLTMNAKQTTTPSGVNTTIYIVSICFRGDIESLRGEVLKLVSTDKQYLLSMDMVSDKNVIDPVGSEKEKEFVEEFFPPGNGNGKSDGSEIIDIEPVDVKGVEGKPFSICAICGEEQFETPSGVSCKNGHGGADSIDIKPNVEPEQIPDPEPTHDPETKPPEQTNSLEPVGSYKTTYDKFIAEKNIGLAYSFAKRLQKGNLIYWLKNTYPDIDFDDNAKKPDLLEIVKEILKSTLGAVKKETEPEPEKEQEQTPDPDTDTKPENYDALKDEPEPEKPTNFPQESDESGPIKKEQLRELVRLKLLLESQGTLRADKWKNHVEYFLDKEGNQINTATDLTTVQGENFITMLGDQVKVEN